MELLEILGIIVDHQASDWRSLALGKHCGPISFADACSDEMAQTHAAALAVVVESLRAEQRADHTRNKWWTLVDWLF